VRGSDRPDFVYNYGGFLVDFLESNPASSMSESPKFTDLNQIEENLLVAKLKAARSAIVHAGEKGRALEHVVTMLLRSFLPAEYGLSTGFIVFHTPEGPKLTRQLDVIIYDAVRSSPIISLETCEVLPLEAVYGYVEVKATLTSSSDEATEPAENSIECCLERNRDLRNMKDRRYWVPRGSSPIETALHKHDWVSIRSYIFAFEPIGRVATNLGDLAQRMANVSKRLGIPTHLHGVFVANHGLLFTRPVDSRSAKSDDFHHVNFTTTSPLLAFKTLLLNGLASFPRPQEEWAPAVDQYFEVEPTWDTRAPEI
jgi:hypothetical protein